MIKELFLAIIIGAILGFGVTGGYLTLHEKTQSQKPVIITQPTTIPTPITQLLTNETNNPTNNLNISSPENNLLVSNSSLNIIGNTTSNSQIIINTATQSFSGQRDQEGLFDIPMQLDAGLNIIKISAIDSFGNQLDTEINITYSTAKI
jgi:hypothetical protein